MPNRIREIRLEAGLSQQVLGDRIGVTKVTISDLERGKMRLDIDYMRRIAHALSVKPSDLLPCEDNADSLSHDERKLIEKLRKADPATREQIHRVAEVMLPFKGEGSAES
ncbi:MAG: helix-turn-helix transcriptional regulator [Sphingomonadales bacterium]|nr:helix-turn-helix transcriptional regulator [Sphingomonadales bacterium]MBD3773975.1 helix-turn-helix transcriptional regulator [Paracoccaceae bacterium]